MSNPVRPEAVDEVLARSALEHQLSHGLPVVAPNGVRANCHDPLDDLKLKPTGRERRRQLSIEPVCVEGEVIDVDKRTKCKVEGVVASETECQHEQAAAAVEEGRCSVAATVAQQLV